MVFGRLKSPSLLPPPSIPSPLQNDTSMNEWMDGWTSGKGQKSIVKWKNFNHIKLWRKNNNWGMCAMCMLLGNISYKKINRGWKNINKKVEKRRGWSKNVKWNFFEICDARERESICLVHVLLHRTQQILIIMRMRIA